MMSDITGDEHLQLILASNKARREGDILLYEQLQSRITALEDIKWQRIVECFNELSHYRSTHEALKVTANHLNVPFPDTTSGMNSITKGRFIFGVSDGKRTVQVWPMSSRGYYDLEVFDYEERSEGDCYKGHTRSLDDTTIVLSRWFVERCSIQQLHTQFPWMSCEPFRLQGARLCFE